LLPGESIYPVRTWPPDKMYFPQCTFRRKFLVHAIRLLNTRSEKKARQSDLSCPVERSRGWLQRIQEREQLLLLLFSELSEAPGHVLCLTSVPFNGIF